MSRYQETLAAFGISDEEIRLHVLDNDIGLFRNRESAAYGRQEPDETQKESQQ